VTEHGAIPEARDEDKRVKDVVVVAACTLNRRNATTHAIAVGSQQLYLSEQNAGLAANPPPVQPANPTDEGAGGLCGELL
jgi:hypothetical protein